MQEWTALKTAAGKHGTKDELEASRQVLLVAFEHVGVDPSFRWVTGTGKRSKGGSRHGVHTYTAQDVRYWCRGRAASALVRPLPRVCQYVLSQVEGQCERLAW